mmetsp:Transcript_50853/g.95126  ORF Transcript_50853/g.95126 Transcript_50853/m.95126 type:complete len:374 (-) Transcript_50853:68-1189(-)
MTQRPQTGRLARWERQLGDLKGLPKTFAALLIRRVALPFEGGHGVHIDLSDSRLHLCIDHWVELVNLCEGIHHEVVVLEGCLESWVALHVVKRLIFDGIDRGIVSIDGCSQLVEQLQAPLPVLVLILLVARNTFGLLGLRFSLGGPGHRLVEAGLDVAQLLLHVLHLLFCFRCLVRLVRLDIRGCHNYTLLVHHILLCVVALFDLGVQLILLRFKISLHSLQGLCNGLLLHGHNLLHVLHGLAQAVPLCQSILERAAVLQMLCCSLLLLVHEVPKPLRLFLSLDGLVPLVFHQFHFLSGSGLCFFLRSRGRCLGRLHVRQGFGHIPSRSLHCLVDRSRHQLGLSLIADSTVHTHILMSRTHCCDKHHRQNAYS